VDRPDEFDHVLCPSRVLDPRETSSRANHNNIDNNSTGSITPYYRSPSPIDCGNSHERSLLVTIRIHHQIRNNNTIINNNAATDDVDVAILE
jgi:hypothetical protein